MASDGTRASHALQLLKEELEASFKRMSATLKLLDAAIKPEDPIQHQQPYELTEVVEPPALEMYFQRSANADVEPTFRGLFSIVDSAGESSGLLRLHPQWLQLQTHCASYRGMGDVLRTNESYTTGPLRKQPSLSLSESLFEITIGSQFFSRPFNPEGNFRICWDLASLVLLLFDAVFLPLSIAWEWKMSFDSVSGMILTLSIWVSLIFWSIDILINLNTAVYIHGTLHHGRTAILKHYAKTWMLLDIGIVGVDYLNLAQDFDANLTYLRFGRLFRAFRMLRLLKMTKLDEIVQELAASTGRQWIMLVIAIFNSAIAAALAAHMATCIWYGVGAAVQERGISWIERADAVQLGGGTQYIHALRYVMNSPSPPPIEPDSSIERMVDIMNNVFTLAVIGSAVSKISGTLVELRAMNESRSRQRREVRVYLSNQDASFELVSRIMKFVEYKLEKITPVTFDSTLISTTLQTELYVSQRGEFLEAVPIFNLTKVLYPECFSVICGHMKKHVFEMKEKIFHTGAVSTQLYVTVAGKFLIAEVERPTTQRVVLGSTWFEELALYAEGMIHHSTLTAKTFSEVLTLESQDLVNVLQNVPDCASMFCEYAKAFIKSMSKLGSKMSHESETEQGEQCARKTTQYQEMFPDAKTRLKNIRLFPTEMEDLTPSFDLLPLDGSTISGTLPRPRTGGLDEILQKLAHAELDIDSLEDMLFEQLPELDRFAGTYAIIDQAGERDRAESSCISLLSLVSNRYDLFVRPQDTNCLTTEQWSQLQEVLLSWDQPTTEQIHAALVLNAVRGLGKSVTLQSQIADAEGQPEQTLRALIINWKNVVPSVLSLSTTATHYLHSVLTLHETFNVAQMLQGENVPASVAQLQEKLSEYGGEVFHCYLLFLFGFMSGLGGGRGSKFMTARMAPSLIACTQVFTGLNQLSARAVYWEFLRRRALSLGAPFLMAEDLALARLACLSRVHTPAAFVKVQAAWSRLSWEQQAILVDHFLADGIDQPAFIFTFLPDCIQKAMANQTVGLRGLLEVLVDLLTQLKAAGDSVKLPGTTWIVDLSDLTEFMGMVQNRFVFKTCISRAKLELPDPGKRQQVRLQMTSANWSRIQEVDSDVMSVSHQVNDVAERLRWLEQISSNDSWGI